MDMIRHQSQREGTWKGDSRRERSSKQIDHREGKHSEDHRNNPEIPFGFWERVKNVGKYEEEWKLKVGWVLLVVS
jgi:hypothetical protein